MQITHPRERTLGALYRFYLGALGLIVLVAVGVLIFGGSSSTRSHVARQATGSAAHARSTIHAKSAVHSHPAVGTAPASSGAADMSTPVTTPAAASATPATVPAAAATPATTPPASSTTFTPVAVGSGPGCTAGVTDGSQWIKYTVQPGDSLSKIAGCFALNGYQSLYEQNIAVLGPNPNLIHPGQVITIVNGTMVVTPPTS